MKNTLTMNVGKSNTAQVGEPPKYDLDLGAIKKQLTRKIREKILMGGWPAEDRHEEQMVRDFKASGLSVEKFLNAWTR